MTIAEQLKEEGKKERNIEITKRLLKKGMDITDIIDVTQLSKEKIEEIKNENIESNKDRYVDLLKEYEQLCKNHNIMIGGIGSLVKDVSEESIKLCIKHLKIRINEEEIIDMFSDDFMDERNQPKIIPKQQKEE